MYVCDCVWRRAPHAPETAPAPRRGVYTVHDTITSLELEGALSQQRARRATRPAFHFAQMPQLQETCLYPRLNEALRNHDTRSLEPFLPFMKLLLSGLYRLPLVHGRTYRGVKLELFEVNTNE